MIPGFRDKRADLRGKAPFTTFKGSQFVVPAHG